jgi:hypothetical protein
MRPGHHRGDRLPVAFRARLSGRGGAQEARLTLQSEKTDGERVYRVIEPQAA